MVTEHGSGQRWPRLLGDEDALDVTTFDELAGGCLEDRDINTEEWERSRPWLGGGCSWERGDVDRTSLGHPVSVDDGCVSTTNVVVVPMPSLGVDRLSDTTNNTQTRKIVILDPILTESAEKTNGLWMPEAISMHASVCWW